MTKVYPNAATVTPPPPDQLTGRNQIVNDPGGHAGHVNLTVWKKSLLFNCDGFTVFDSYGNLVFRVDNYIPRKGILLMDASGSSLLTIRRHKRLGLTDNWLVYDGETCVNPRFCARKHVPMNFLKMSMSRHSSSQRLAQVVAVAGGRQGNSRKKMIASSSSSSSTDDDDEHVIYEIEGSYRERCCTVYDGKRRRAVAEIKRKEASCSRSGGVVLLGADVFRLIILEPAEMDSTVAMALVVLLDQMFSSS